MAAFLWTKFLVRTGIAQWFPSVRQLMQQQPEYLRFYSDRVIGAPLDALLDEATFPESNSPDVLHLDLAAPRMEAMPSRPLRMQEIGRMSRGIPELRQVIADQTERNTEMSISADDEILITPGATGALSIALDSFLNPGQSVVVFDPTSPLFSVGVRSRRGRIRTVPAWVESDGRLRFPLDRFAKAMRGARMLMLADPAIPHGGCLASEDLEQIAWWAKRHDVLIYLDETLARYRTIPATRHLAAIPETAGRLLLANSLGKSHGQGALRAGWLIGAKPLIRAATLTAGLNTAGVPLPCQEMALSVLRANGDRFAELQQTLDSRRRYLTERLALLGLPATPTGVGYSLWISTQPLGLTGREFATRLLRDKRVLLGPGDVFGPSGLNFVRLSFAAEDGRLREGMTRMSEWLMENYRQVPTIPNAGITEPVPEPMIDRVSASERNPSSAEGDDVAVESPRPAPSILRTAV
ncbi:pyridoxal phosphate-dependent aminotransferase [Tuwongella immobilis]|uniref:pyridoxal phosphate-dependent aminotransferase n=1 Tax=Tuwongella immobilis TaxID=692036 RepID=UPI0013A6F01E|nr:pyridoxal phosphate-dependent aminotransferase [Tuwongella immobilis]